MSTAPAIADDLTCAQCGYDLRALPLDSNCPECGRAIIDSLRTRPLTRWLPRFRRGVTFLCVFMAARTPWIQNSLYDIAWYRLRVNPEGFFNLVYALLIFPAAWFMTTLAPFRPRHIRKWLMGLLVAQIILALCALKFFRHPWPLDLVHGNMILLSAYGVMPLVDVAELWLLLELLYRSHAVLRTPLPRQLYRFLQWPLIYSLLGPAIFFGIVSFARIKYDDPLPGSRYWINPTLSRFLEAVLVTPPVHIQLYAWLAFLVMLFYCRFQMRQGAVLRSA